MKSKWFMPRAMIPRIGRRSRRRGISCSPAIWQAMLRLRAATSLLQLRILRSTSPRIDFIGGIRGTKELERLVGEGKAVVAFSMYPTTVPQLMDIADAGQIMPPKSTWFEPKLRDGLVTHGF